MRHVVGFVGLAVVSSAAQAGDKVLIQPVPAWVKPAPPIDTAKLGDASPVLLVLDNQQKLEDGQVWTYMESATRAASPQILGAIGTVQLPWQPAQGDLIIHRVEILRGGQTIDLLKDGKGFTVLRREQQLDQRMLDGMLTATMPVEGLSVGDVLHLVVSVTRKDPTLKGDLHTFAPLLADPMRVQFARTRLLWPEKSDVHWRAYSKGLTAAPTVAGGWRELSVAMPLPKAPEMPGDAPMRFQNLPLLEASTFADWPAVSKVMAPLYVTDGLIAPGSPLAGEVATIAKASTDPMVRAAMALRLVQEKVRYLLMGMDTGNYVPQSPAQTWSLRYGDCKAKTLLLLAMLHALGIEAEPVLANSKAGEIVEQRLPGTGAFDHVLVRATIAGESLWLDGTDSGARLADLRDTPPFGTVLPVRTAGAMPMPIAMRIATRPDVSATVELDESAGVNLPAPFTATITMRGAVAEQVKLGNAQGSKADFDNFAQTIAKGYVTNPAVVTRTVSFDDAAGTATLRVTGIAYPEWANENRRLRAPLDALVGSMEFKPDRARAAWSAIPVRIAPQPYNRVVTRVKLPGGGGGFTIEGERAVSATLAGLAIDRTVTQEGAWVTVDQQARGKGAEIAAADIPVERKRLVTAQAHLPRLVAAADHPPLWKTVEDGRKARRFDQILALYAKRIADDPADRQRYTDRAWFNERIYDRRAALADLDKAITLEPDADTYLRRSSLHAELGNTARAIADAEAALKVDPSSSDAVYRVASLRDESGDTPGAVAIVQERIDAGGKEAASFMANKAEFQAHAGDKDAAIATIDAAVADKPGDPSLLNSRCWIKGTANVALDSALKDCTKAIELADSATSALDSRALVYFRLGRLDEALADLDAALELEPMLSASLYMRGVVRHRQGKAAEGDVDLAAARLIEPQIDRDYARYGIKP